jgi:hypothetical protein
MTFFEVAMQTRKQENALTISDLNQFPIWEYALDEEDVPGQNEKTIRPYLIPPHLIQMNAYFVVRTRFTLANGASLIGFIKPLTEKDNKLMKPLLPYDLSPVIVTDQGHVPFCYGVFKPNEATISENYKRLGYEAENVFPISFMFDIEVPNSVGEGVLYGFLYFDQDLINFFNLNKSDIKYVK